MLHDATAVGAKAVISDTEIRTVGGTWAENLLRTLTHPVVSSLLMTVGLLGILIEIRTPGFGVAGCLGFGAILGGAAFMPYSPGVP